MDTTEKKAVRFGGGGALLFGGGWLADKTSSYAWEGMLNLLTAGMGEGVTWETFPWRNAIGVASIIAGIVVIAWPWLKRLSGRMTLNEERVISLINDKIATLPNHVDIFSDASQFQELTTRKIEGLAAIQKTAIEENKTTHQLCNSLKNDVAALAVRGFALPTNILEDIQKGVSALDRINHAKRVEEAKSALVQCETRHLQTPANNTSMRKGAQNAQILGSIQMSAAMLGIDHDYIEQKKEEIKKGVEADAQFLEFTDDDKKTWLHKFEKRDFIIHSKQRDALLEMIRKVANSG